MRGYLRLSRSTVGSQCSMGNARFTRGMSIKCFSRKFSLLGDKLNLKPGISLEKFRKRRKEVEEEQKTREERNARRKIKLQSKERDLERTFQSAPLTHINRDSGNRRIHPGRRKRPLKSEQLTPASSQPHINLNFGHGDVSFDWGAGVTPEQTYSVNVSIIGAPNAGKSQLTNRLVGKKVSAVSKKRNTTREEMVGVVTQGDTQLVIHDTPGINSSRTSRDYARELSIAAWQATRHCDIGLVMIDAAKRPTSTEFELIEKAKTLAASQPNMQLILVLNKVDLVTPKQKLIPRTNLFAQRADWQTAFFISARTGDGCDDLEAYLYDCAIPREWEFEENTHTDQSPLEIVNEVIREKLFRRLNQEVPYNLTQETKGWTELSSGALRIDHTIYVNHLSQSPIVIGKQGAVLKTIGRDAKKDLELLFKRKVHIFFEVVVKKSTHAADSLELY